jgi:hypothetical protein
MREGKTDVTGYREELAVFHTPVDVLIISSSKTFACQLRLCIKVVITVNQFFLLLLLIAYIPPVAGACVAMHNRNSLRALKAESRTIGMPLYVKSTRNRHCVLHPPVRSSGVLVLIKMHCAFIPYTCLPRFVPVNL